MNNNNVATFCLMVKDMKLVIKGIIDNKEPEEIVPGLEKALPEYHMC